MAAVGITQRAAQLWAAFVTLFSTLLALVGLPGTRAAARRSSGPEGITRSSEGSLPVSRPSVPEGSATVPRPLAGVRDRSLPPTIKQRIRAEAHGSSPSARRLTGAAGPAAPVPVDGDEPLVPALAAA